MTIIIEGTRQELADQLVEHLHKQGCRSGDITIRDGTKKFSCLYLDKNMHTCGIGFKIPLAQYDPSIEGRSVTDLLASVMITRPGMDLSHRNPSPTPEEYDERDFLQEMQRCHDEANSLINLKQKLHEFFNKWKLVDGGKIDAITEWEASPA